MEYDVIVADPPWRHSGDQYKMGAAGNHYETMPLTEIWKQEPPLAKPGILFLWATGPLLDTALATLEAWGLHYRGVPFVWVKTRRNGVPIKAQGVRPSIVKPLTEFVLAGSTERLGRPLPLADEGICQTVFAPKRRHSEKPDEVQERIERMYPLATRLEMYARRRRDGWDAHGDEVADV